MEIKTAQGLTEVYCQLDRLIPDQLGAAMGREALAAVELHHFELGHGDNAYVPSLRVGFIKKGGVPFSTRQRSDKWDVILDCRQIDANNAGFICDNDWLLSLLVAHEYFPYGVCIEAYIQSSTIRGRGVGTGFYQNLEQVLQELGYKFLWGIHEDTNINFFLKQGRYPFSRLLPESFDRYYLGIERCYRGYDQATIKFLDPELEKNCVKPEFLNC